ncbi:hypothetical protein QZH41_001932 [Actinostola sp. cb2023]|nr:hypothetical protein QZH41_001932 [Actinostola sp. cb2023]
MDQRSVFPPRYYYTADGYQYSADPYNQHPGQSSFMNSYPLNPAFMADQGQFQRQNDSPMSSSSSSTTSTTTGTDKPSAANASTSSKTKGKKYDTWTQDQQKLLVQLWAEHHEWLESKEARKAWRKICDEFNSREEVNKTVEKCQKKMKYLIDRYKIAKEWNRKQSGGSKRKSIFYDEINAILGCRDIVTMNNVSEAGTSASSSSALNTSSSSSTSTTSTADDDTARMPARKEKEQNVEEKKVQRRDRKSKKRQHAYESDEDDAERKEFSESLKCFKESGEKLGNFMDNFSQIQQQQTTMMGQFLGALTQFMTANQNKDKSSQ